MGILANVVVFGMFIVYGLRDPSTGEYRYIGKSSSGLSRPKQHAKDAKKGEDSYKAKWIRKLQANDLELVIDILEETSKDSLSERETWWIAWFRPFGRLTNISEGALYEGDQRAASRMALEKTTPEQRSAAARKAGLVHWATITPEARKEHSDRSRLIGLRTIKIVHAKHPGVGGRSRMAKLTPEERKLQATKAGLLAWKGVSPEQRSAYSVRANRARWDATTSDERQEYARKAWSNKSEEEIAKLYAGRDAFSASLTNQERSSRATRASHAISTSERRVLQSQLMAKRTPEKRKAIATKGWETRRAIKNKVDV